MAHVSNLPGAGRTLGLLYDFLGRKIERTVNRLTYSLRYGRRTPQINPQMAFREMVMSSFDARPEVGEFAR